MKSQSSAVMEQTKEPQPVEHSSEEISNHVSQIYNVILEGGREF
jgi:hypothetical protein